MGQNILINQAHTIIIFYSKHDLNLMGKKKIFELTIFIHGHIYFSIFIFLN